MAEANDDWDCGGAGMNGDEDSGDDSFNEAFGSDDEDQDDVEFAMDRMGAAAEDDFKEAEDESQQVLTQAQAQALLDELVGSVAGLLSISEDLASALLRCFKWDKERVATAYFADPEEVLAKLGLQCFDRQPPEAVADDSGMVTCDICDDDELPVDDVLALGCGHYFCRGCWRDYMVDQVCKGKDAVLARCPMHKCGCRVPDSFVERVLGGPQSEHWQRYGRFLVKAFVEDCPGMRWCPAPRCELVLRGAAHLRTVICTGCGNAMCWHCGQETHQPASCSQLAQWLLKCSGESETAKWIIANTKRCPGCGVRIERDRGCNHMTHAACGTEFCWVCDGPWAEHGNHTGGFYKCNKYDPKSYSSDGRVNAKADLDRYLFYYHRYANHDQSRKFAEKLRLATERRMQELQREQQLSQSGGDRPGAGGWMDVQFLQAATEQVLKCRSVLKYTYVFAYFLEEGPEKTLFEFLQQELERATEHLSELSEQPLEKISRPEIANFTRVTDQFLRNLLEGTAEGLTADSAAAQQAAAAVQHHQQQQQQQPTVSARP